MSLLSAPDPRSPFIHRSTSRVGVLLGLALLLGLVSAPTAFAQAPAGAPLDPAPSESVEAPADPLVVPEGLASARATLQTFLEAFDPEKRDPDIAPLDQAASTLDLSQIRHDLRGRQGHELARQLKEVLDRTELIDFSRVPDDPAGEPYSIDVAEGARVVLAPDDRGVWRFTTETVDEIPLFLQLTQGQEIVEGVVDGVPMTPSLWIRSKLSPGWLEAPFLLENWQWLGLAILLFLGAVLDRLLTALAQSAIERFLARRMESVDPVRLKTALRPAGAFIAALFCWASFFWLGLPTRTLEVLLFAAQLVAAVAFVGTAYRMVDIVAAVLEVRANRSENKFDDLLVPLFRKSMKLIVAAFGIAFLAEILSLPVRSVIAGLGIGGLALALAAQDVVKNLFGSLTVLLDRPFSVGDWVQIGDVEGTVAELGFRSTRIRTFYDSMVTVPNSNLISASVDNFGARTYRRWKTNLGIAYETPPETIDAFCEGIRELVRQHPMTRKDSFQVHLNSFGDSGLNILLYIFFRTPDWGTELRERHRLALDILRLAETMGVEIAYPTQTLYLRRDGDSSESIPTEEFARQLAESRDGAREIAGRLAASNEAATK